MRLKRTVAGNTVGEATVQVNVKIAKYGKKPIIDAP
jgi:ribosomal protein S6E (S10)